eukprot:UN00061
MMDIVQNKNIMGILFGDTKFTIGKNQKWKDIGFQGNDPTTDFRGMGMHALACLTYLAKNETTFCHNVMKSMDDDIEHYYPLAANLDKHSC